MSTCDWCGESIEFRYVDGARRPIHINGGWCRGVGDNRNAPPRFRSIESYINPNACCPVCGDRVFFYQSEYGGRVYFDAVGWPWPKHPCTDKQSAQHGQVAPLTPQRYRMVLKSGEGDTLDIYEAIEIKETENKILIHFRRVSRRNRRDHTEFWAWANTQELQRNNIKVGDFRAAPSFIIKREHPFAERPVVEFICGRRKAILKVRMRRDD
jgi:hypothetical protein